MPLDSSLRTSVSLLGRLRQEAPDPDAWPQFVRRYGPLLYRWCRSRGLQEADIEDVTQEVLVKLARRLRTFHYDDKQSFRSYLKTLTHTRGATYWPTDSESPRGPGTAKYCMS